MELDHIFLFVRNRETAAEMMREAGLKVNYSRRHPGQGTRNFCACLDDVFLELLWLDGTKISSESERIGLGSRGRGTGSPLGVSWRGSTNLDCVDYDAPFLPDGISIPVARPSLDPSLPFLFQTPDGTRPIDRKDDLTGDRQSPKYATLGNCRMSVPNPELVADLLAPIERIEVIEGPPGLQASLLNGNGNVAGEVRWQVSD